MIIVSGDNGSIYFWARLTGGKNSVVYPRIFEKVKKKKKKNKGK